MSHAACLIIALTLLAGCGDKEDDTAQDDTSSQTEPDAVCEAAGSARAVARIEVVDQGLGVEAVNTTITGCSDESVQVYQTCCGTRERQVEWFDKSQGSWIAYTIEDDCDCVGLTDETLAPWGAVTFSTSVSGGPELCKIGGADFRVTYAVGPEDCADDSCFEEIVSDEFLLYCEG
ncbi:MAG: hypothetical protein ACI8RZ_001376 [Myxococcota bacterium]|jgi:hypothetical protein